MEQLIHKFSNYLMSAMYQVDVPEFQYSGYNEKDIFSFHFSSNLHSILPTKEAEKKQFNKEVK